MEWMDEPDREEFEHAGYRCLILRHPELKILCGYVGVPTRHPCSGKHYDHIPYEDLLVVEVHGGLTFAGEGDDKFRPAGYWWLGFDCGHFRDLVPQIVEIFNRPPNDFEIYKNFQYVRQETKSLAEQLAKLEFIDWQFAVVWPLFLPLKPALRIWGKRREKVNIKAATRRGAVVSSTAS